MVRMIQRKLTYIGLILLDKSKGTNFSEIFSFEFCGNMVGSELEFFYIDFISHLISIGATVKRRKLATLAVPSLQTTVGSDLGIW